jgi:hypothetical protein
MSSIDIASEVAAFRSWQWQAQRFEKPFSQLGEYEFIAELARFVKTIRPELLLSVSEAAIIDNVSGNDAHSRHYKMLIEMLTELNNLQAPIELVQLQNEAWIGIPPTENTIDKPVKEILALGYDLDAPDTIVATGDTNPIWTNWPQLVEVSKDRRGKLLQQSDIYWLIFKVYLENGVRSLGVYSLSGQDDWLQSNSNLFDISNNPMPSFFRVQDLILDY